MLAHLFVSLFKQRNETKKADQNNKKMPPPPPLSFKNENEWNNIQQKMETSLKGLNLQIDSPPRIRVIDRIEDKREKNKKLYDVFTHHLELMKEEAKKNKKEKEK